MRCSPCRAVTLSLTSPVLAYVALLLLCAFTPSPTPHDIERDAFGRLLNGEVVSRVYRNPARERWQRSHFALSYALTSRTLRFPHSNASLSLVDPSLTPVELTVHLGDTYIDSWFAPADDVLLWVATRPLVNETFEGWVAALVTTSDDNETGERIIELRPVSTTSSGSYQLDERTAASDLADPERWYYRGPSLLTLLYPNSTARTPSALFYPSLHVANDFRAPLEVADPDLPPALAHVLAPSYTLPFRLVLVRVFGAFTLRLGEGIDNFGWVLGWALEWGFKALLGAIVWMACSKPLGREIKRTWNSLGEPGDGDGDGEAHAPGAGLGASAKAPAGAAKSAVALDREKPSVVLEVVVLGDEKK